ncbi:Histidine kinase-, DNA gyrase B-, and HSP90-like ATPase [Sporobacter termitidis DSM 10068]|uniref:Histidine kinase-, DNA gyrase B-, and HSP90-like ATPase n=1 Tax=Sporobacter termitidis DSM 10068 TaxID=1123282 RepID=A0A1M5U172_9FIRM|nr:ATP-binding protein [Sporobacter termitidis]SHH56704.1 Histidine kinase-, DNA gyrase B-, and HSP90-like ATPase [Sporobacter termitidis DSM 10068]
MNPKLAVPDAASLVLSLRSVGYSLETAIADIVDNSITAKASEIYIDANWNSEFSFISICDNGYGMNENDLHQAMKIGAKVPTDPRSNDDLGRFGMGLKTAAFSLCKRLTVMSKVSDKNMSNIRVWDIDNIVDSNRWELFDDSQTSAWRNATQRFKNHLQGTIVVLEKLDRLITEDYSDQAIGRFWQRIADMEKHLTMVFHRFLAGQTLRIFVNGKRIEPWDPFMRTSFATQEFREEFLTYQGKSVRVHTFILPHHSKLSMKEYDDTGGASGWQEQQGFYVYRNRRLIVPGTWFKMLRKNEPGQLARIQLDLTGDMDFDWKIDVKKSSASPPSILRENIRRIARTAQEASRKVYYFRGAVINQQIKAEDNDAVWEQASIRGRTFFRINRKHRLLEEACSGLGVDSKKKLDTFMSLIEGFAPMNASLTGPIFNETSQGNGLIDSAAHFCSDLIEAGYSPCEALRKVLQISIYEGMGEAIKDKLKL